MEVSKYVYTTVLFTFGALKIQYYESFVLIFIAVNVQCCKLFFINIYEFITYSVLRIFFSVKSEYGFYNYVNIKNNTFSSDVL